MVRFVYPEWRESSLSFQNQQLLVVTERKFADKGYALMK